MLRLLRTLRDEVVSPRSYRCRRIGSLKHFWRRRAAGRVAVKDHVNAIALAPAEDFRRDSALFGEGVRNPEAQRRFQAALKRGFQTRDAEMDLARLLGDLADH
jgi:hypothetical protein